MSELKLDLSQDATRRFLTEELLGRLDARQREDVARSLGQAGVPDSHHRNLGEVEETIDVLQVSDRVKNDMRAIYHILAQAEAQVHGVSLEETHFHEVGRGEGIKNTLGICLAIEALAPDRIVATSVQVGRGTVVCSHGELDIPAPATRAVLADDIPLCCERLEGEFCTPTSAAIIRYFVDDFIAGE